MRLNLSEIGKNEIQYFVSNHVIKDIAISNNDVILEENTSFILVKDFKYREHSYCPPNAKCIAPPELTIKSGTKVNGTLFREPNNTLYRIPKGGVTPPSYNDYLDVKGDGTKGSIKIPIEYLTRDIQVNSGTIVPVKNNNKLLIIAGAFLAGYILFRNSKSSN